MARKSVWIVTDYDGSQIGPCHLTHLDAEAAVRELRAEGVYGLRITEAYA